MMPSHLPRARVHRRTILRKHPLPAPGHCGLGVLGGQCVGQPYAGAAGRQPDGEWEQRYLRLLRLVSALPKLQLLVGALFKSLSAMGYVSLLLALLFYVYAVGGVHLFGRAVPDECFRDKGRMSKWIDGNR